MTIAERLELTTPADLTETSLRFAVDELHASGTAVVLLVVHPYGKHLAQSLAWSTGWKMPVQVNETFDEDEWLVRGENGLEVHSQGA